MKKYYLISILFTFFYSCGHRSGDDPKYKKIHFGTRTQDGGCSGDGICSIADSIAKDSGYGAPFADSVETVTRSLKNLIITLSIADALQSGFHPPKDSCYYVQKGDTIPIFLHCFDTEKTYIACDSAIYSLNKNKDSIILKVAVSCK